MGNSLSTTTTTDKQQSTGRRAGLSKLLRHKTSKCRGGVAAKAGAVVLPTAEAAAGRELQDDCPVIQSLLEALDLSIYCDAFLLAGWGGGGTSSVCDLAALTEADLAQVQALSKVPILPHPQSLILAACRQLGASLGSPPDAPAASGAQAAAAATPPAAAAAAVQGQQPVTDTALDATAYADQTSPAPNKAARGSASSQQGKAGVVQHGSQSGVQSPCLLMVNPFLSDQTNSTPASRAAASAAAAVGAASDMHPSLAHGAQTPLTACGSASSSKHAAADGTRPAATAQAAPAGDVSPEAETHGALCPSSSLSSRSQRAADAAAAAASSLTQAAMHFHRASLSEHSMQQQRQAQQHVSTQQPQETPCSAGSPSLSACMPRALYATAADDAAAVGQGSPADAAAPKAERCCFFHDPEHSSEWEWDDSNPFLVSVLPAPKSPQHSSLGAQQAAGGDGCAVSEGPEFACTDQSEDAAAAAVPFPEAAATAVAAGRAALSSRAAAAVAAGAGAAAFGGPLTSHRSHLPRPSSSSRGLSCESRNLSSPEAAAAAAARLSGLGCAWNKLPGEVASLSFAATTSLHTKPLPALAAVASGQPQKQRAVVAEPGALTVHAGQLPLRPVSDCGLSMWPTAAAAPPGRHPGLRAEESAAGAAVALQQLSCQQASNQDLIHRLLYAPPAGSQSAHPGGGCPSVDHLLEPWTGPYSGHQGYSLAAQQGPSALLLPEGSAVSSVLDHSTARLLLVQQPPQVLVLGPQGVPGLVATQQQHQQQWQTLQQDRSSASIAGSPVGPGLTGFSGAHSCIQLGAARSHAADVNDIVLRTKARAAAKQQLLLQRQHQHQQHNYVGAGGHYQQQQRQPGPDVTPATPVLATDRLTEETLAGGGLKGAAAMLACNLRPDAASCWSVGTFLAGAAPASAGTRPYLTVPDSPLSGPGGTAAGSSSLTAAVRDGDRVLQMLQECKELAELDRAVKSRMMQLLHSAAASQSSTAAAAASQSSTAAAAASQSSTAAAAASQSSAAAATASQSSAAAAAASQSSTAAAGAQAATVPDKAHGAPADSGRCAGPEDRPGQHAQTADGSNGRSPQHVLSQVRSQQQRQQQGCGAGTAHPAVGTNSCAGVLHAASVRVAPAAQAAVLRPQTSGSVAGASTADAPAPSSRKAADQAHAPQQAGMQNKDSPAGKGLVQHSAQHSDQQKAGGLHSSPSRQTASTKTARQLWQATRVPAAAAAASDAGPDSVPAHPAAKILGAAGMPGQPVKGSSVAALVAAVAGRPSRA